MCFPNCPTGWLIEIKIHTYTTHTPFLKLKTVRLQAFYRYQFQEGRIIYENGDWLSHSACAAMVPRDTAEIMVMT